MTDDVPSRPAGPYGRDGQEWPALAKDSSAVPVLDLTFDSGILPELRADLWACAIQSGFSEDRVRDIVLAVHELAANTIVHDGQAGRLRAWELAGALHCQVDDGDLMRSLEELASRDGMTGIRSSRAWDSVSVNSLPCEPGHGLAVVRQLADQAQSLSSPRGTSILITFGLHS